jgi:hypothetical protein
MRIANSHTFAAAQLVSTRRGCEPPPLSTVITSHPASTFGLAVASTTIIVWCWRQPSPSTTAPWCQELTILLLRIHQSHMMQKQLLLPSLQLVQIQNTTSLMKMPCPISSSTR